MNNFVIEIAVGQGWSACSNVRAGQVYLGLGRPDRGLTGAKQGSRGALQRLAGRAAGRSVLLLAVLPATHARHVHSVGAALHDNTPAVLRDNKPVSFPSPCFVQLASAVISETRLCDLIVCKNRASGRICGETGPIHRLHRAPNIGQHQGSLTLLPLHQRRELHLSFIVSTLDSRLSTFDHRPSSSRRHLRDRANQNLPGWPVLHCPPTQRDSVDNASHQPRILPSTPPSPASRRLCDRVYLHHRSRLAFPSTRNGRHADDGHHSTDKHHGHWRRRRRPARTAPVLLRQRGMHLPETQLLRPVERRAGCPHGRENGAGQSIPPHSLVTLCFFDRVARLCLLAVLKPPRARGILCACPCRACVMQNGRSRVTLATAPGRS